MARNAASTISPRTFLRCSRQRSLRASTFTPGLGPAWGNAGRGILTTSSTLRAAVADLGRLASSVSPGDVVLRHTGMASHARVVVGSRRNVEGLQDTLAG